MRCGGVGLALLLQCLTLPSRAMACVVGTGAGTCTESALGACLPGGGSFDGTVTFDCGGAATIIVTSTKTMSADTTIDGESLITISGGDSVGVFSVNTGVKFTVQNLTIADGNNHASYVGGGISNGMINGAGSIIIGGMVTVINSTFSGNTAGTGGAIANFGTLTVTNSTFSGNSATGPDNGAGGGILNYGGTLTVTNSTFSGNSASPGDGGGIASAGTVTVTNSTFSGNSAAYGGGILGGGMLNGTGSTLSVTNSTFSGNSAVGRGPDWRGGGGGIDNDGTLTVTNSTFSGNSADHGGVISNKSVSVTVTNTIVANSTSGGNCTDYGGGSVTDGGHNIDDGTTCGFTGTGCTATTGTSFCNTNPVLDPTGLQNNGGPTQTIALQAGSPAVNAGDESVCSAAPVNSLDQRGFVRPGAGATSCSIGAYEYNAPGPPPCEGDCNSDRHVTVDEILTMVNIALGNTATACDAGDANHDGQITVDEILAAVNNALNECVQNP